jgi:hypothetical protein
MSAVVIAVSVAFLSAGFALLVWAVDRASVFYSDLAKALIFLGAFVFIISLEVVRREQKKKDRESHALLETMRSIQDEIKGLRGDLAEKGVSRKTERGVSEEKSDK